LRDASEEKEEQIELADWKREERSVAESKEEGREGKKANHIFSPP